MRRVAWALLAVALAALCLLLWRSRTSDAPAPRAQPAAADPIRRAAPRPSVSSWLAAPGLSARRVAGRVIFEGRPVAGAIARLTTAAMDIGDWTLLAQTTGADGRFDFGPVPAGRYHARAEAPGRLAADEIVELRAPEPAPPPDALELALGPCRLRVHGMVRDAAGGIVAGARVWDPLESTCRHASLSIL